MSNAIDHASSTSLDTEFQKRISKEIQKLSAAAHDLLTLPFA